MATITQYRLLRNSNPAMLQMDVNSLISDGYEPFGAIGVDFNNNYVQPMVKKTSDSNGPLIPGVL